MLITTKLTETSGRGLELVNQRLTSQYEVIVNSLRQELGPDHAFLFAESQDIGGAFSNSRDRAWFVSGVHGGTPVFQLDEDSGTALRRRFAGLAADIEKEAQKLDRGGGESARDLALLLRAALTVPDLDTCLWSVEGRPVLVNWGFKSITEGTNPKRDGPVGPGPEAPPPDPPPIRIGESGMEPPNKGKIPPPPSPPEEPVGKEPYISFSRVAAILLWLLLALLLAIIGDRLLFACGLGVSKWSAVIPWIGPGYCRQSGDAAALQQAAAMVHERELALAEKMANCGPDCSSPPPHAAPPPKPDKIDDAIEQHRVQTGKIELTLAWDGQSDLDLHVKCPDGEEIYFDRPSACGGLLEPGDLNKDDSALEEHPIEHIVWRDQSPPAGRYRVVVVPFKYRGNDVPGNAAFTVRMTYRFDDGPVVILKEVKRRAGNEREEKEAFAFESPIVAPRHP